MAAHWLRLVAAVLGLAVSVYCSDTVHLDDVAPSFEDIEYKTTPYPTQTEIEQEPLSCYDCTSYMPSCKRTVTDGQIVSRTGCKTKCFLRVGEEQSGALYRGCMDDFLTAQLYQDYVGCRVQEWNGRKSLWCLCDGDLCNGQSLKRLFYYGYGHPHKPQTLEGGREYLEQDSQKLDVHFDDMTQKVDNYNPFYVIEPKMATEDVGSDYEEPMGPVVEENVVESETDEVGTYNGEDYQTDQPEAYQEAQPQGELSPPEQYPEPHLGEYVKEPEMSNEQPEELHTDDKTHSESNTYPGQYLPELPQPRGYVEEHHLPFPNIYPVVPEQYNEQLGPSQHPPQEAQFPGYYPAYPPVNSQFKYYGEDAGVDANQEEEEEEEEAPFRAPEGKSASIGAEESAGYVHPQHYNYPPPQYPPSLPYYYPNQPELQLEPLHYFPYEDVQAKEELKQVIEEPQAEEQNQVIGEGELDSELFCPSGGIFTYEEDCSKFLMCHNDHIHGRPRMYLMRCPGGLVFDAVAMTCMQPEVSQGCKRLPVPDAATEASPEASSEEQEQAEPSEDSESNSYESSRDNQVFEFGY